MLDEQLREIFILKGLSRQINLASLFSVNLFVFAYERIALYSFYSLQTFQFRLLFKSVDFLLLCIVLKKLTFQFN